MLSKIIITLGHPAHFHLFKHLLSSLKNKNVKLKIVAKEKDILSQLLNIENLSYCIIKNFNTKQGILNKLFKIYKTEIELYNLCKYFKPNLIIGGLTEIAHVGRLLNIPSLYFAEDDFKAIYLQGITLHPMVNNLVTPLVTNVGIFNKKTIQYDGYHELAYLHPNYFTPNKIIVEKYFSTDEPYFILRLAQLTAHHDKGITGIDSKIVSKLITLLKQHGNIYITSERELEPEFEQYRLNIDPIDIHHVMAFAKIYIGDSQTMAAEAAVLGTPSIRYNDFVGKLGYLEELENKYGLTYGIKTSKPEKLFEKIKEFLTKPTLKEDWHHKKEVMLNDKIDVTAFMVWFIENYPKSIKIMKDNPDYQYNFK